MNGRVVAEVSVVPLGTGGPSLSGYVAACLDVLKARDDISYELTAMGTILEGPMDKVIEAVKLMHEVPFEKGALRVVTTLKIDDRRDKVLTNKGKIESVLRVMDKGGE